MGADRGPLRQPVSRVAQRARAVVRKANQTRLNVWLLYVAQVSKTLLRGASGNFTAVFVFADGTIDDRYARNGAHAVQQNDDGKRFGRAAVGPQPRIQPLDPSGVFAGQQTELDSVPGDHMYRGRMGSDDRTRAGP